MSKKHRGRLQKWEALIKWQFKKGISEINYMEISRVPAEWEVFPNSEDLWKNLPVVGEETGTTAFLYKPKNGSTFPPHMHNSKELIVFYRGGATVYTPEYEIKVAAGESILIEANQPHVLEFNDEEILMGVFYTPAMRDGGWQAGFL